jgi:hypothetical protein
MLSDIGSWDDTSPRPAAAGLLRKSSRARVAARQNRVMESRSDAPEVIIKSLHFSCIVSGLRSSGISHLIDPESIRSDGRCAAPTSFLRRNGKGPAICRWDRSPCLRQGSFCLANRHHLAGLGFGQFAPARFATAPADEGKILLRFPGNWFGICRHC